MHFDADVGIVGAGPAGAYAAELLALAGARVLILDPRGPWEKPCGGGLTPGAFRAMPELEEVKSRAHRVQTVRVETGGSDAFDLVLDHPLWIVSRRRLAEWQMERAKKAGAEHLALGVTGLRQTSGRHGGWLLSTPEGEVAVQILLGADGAASRVRRTVAPDARIELLPARVRYPQGEEAETGVAVIRLFEGVAGYLWEFPRTDHRSVGIAVEAGTWGRSRMDAELDARLDRTGGNGTLPPAGAVVGTAQFGHGDYRWIAGGDYALLGDAAGLGDPLTGEGIRNAYRSATLFVRAWVEGDPLRYRKLCRDAFREEFRIARLLRHYLFEEGVATRMARNGSRSARVRALASALLNGLNRPDPGACLPPSFPLSLMNLRSSGPTDRWGTDRG